MREIYTFSKKNLEVKSQISDKTELMKEYIATRDQTVEKIDKSKLQIKSAINEFLEKCGITELKSSKNTWVQLFSKTTRTAGRRSLSAACRRSGCTPCSRQHNERTPSTEVPTTDALHLPDPHAHERLDAETRTSYL